ncbi:uncharacterized protein LOC128556554 [Mercenaria mercenaria]|uniref:uncharacterized protein LOC128556554 n=1 Tax=Mercenaria mercenaria TaxID=6596 RepID=UPI00234EF240|nr:uncharacterized protein LOC128556554 [Mercenaria mercenaria]
MSSGRYISSNGLLHLQYVNRFVSGRYICTARNTAIEYAQSSDTVVMVNVEYPALIRSFYVEGREGEIYTIAEEHADIQFTCAPRPQRQLKHNITSSLNVPVRLSFTAIAYPEPGPTGFLWHKEEARRWIPLLSNDDLQISSSGLQTNLTILNVSQQNFGQYRLTVMNDIGKYEQYMFLEEKDSHEQHLKDYSNTTAVIVGVSLGIVSGALAVYSICLTIWVKRNYALKGGTKYEKRRKRQTYTNEVPLEDTKAKETSREAKDINDPQYTSLDDAFKDRNVTYEKLGATQT